MIVPEEVNKGSKCMKSLHLGILRMHVEASSICLCHIFVYLASLIISKCFTLNAHYNPFLLMRKLRQRVVQIHIESAGTKIYTQTSSSSVCTLHCSAFCPSQGMLHFPLCLLKCLTTFEMYGTFSIPSA